MQGCKSKWLGNKYNYNWETKRKYNHWVFKWNQWTAEGWWQGQEWSLGSWVLVSWPRDAGSIPPEPHSTCRDVIQEGRGSFTTCPMLAANPEPAFPQQRWKGSNRVVKFMSERQVGLSTPGRSSGHSRIVNHSFASLQGTMGTWTLLGMCCAISDFAYCLLPNQLPLKTTLRCSAMSLAYFHQPHHYADPAPREHQTGLCLILNMAALENHPGPSEKHTPGPSLRGADIYSDKALSHDANWEDQSRRQTMCLFFGCLTVLLLTS